MKLVLVLALSLAVLLQPVSNQDLTDEELEEEPEGTPEEGEPTLSQAPFEPPQKPSGDVYFAEAFTEEDKVWKTWVSSRATKDGGEVKYDGKCTLAAPSTEGGLEADQGLLIPEAARHYAIAAKLDRPFKFDDAETFVMQYEVNFQTGLSCGGAYVKLLTSADNLDMFEDKTPYSIMFGPDKCGTTSKVHFIVQFKNPQTGEVEEKHSKQAAESMDFFTDKKTHLFTLLIRADGIYHIIVDQKPFLKGDILEDMTPPIIPPKEIDDPEDEMPEDWDEREKIPDPEAVKPEDWDEDAPPKIEDPDAVKPEGWLDNGPEYVEDPDATMPEDWDEEEDGEYEAPMIPNPACEEVGCGEWRPSQINNPAYKGKWKPSLIDNPACSGKWAPRKIDNPSYFEDDAPFSGISPIAAVGFELWTMSENILIDNIIICGELAIANNYARDGWVLKMQSERAVGGAMSLGSWLDSFVELANTYPYLWALYAVAVVLPFVCCIGCCCMKSKPDDAARRKKTDEPTPDDRSESPPKGESFIAAADEQEEERQSQEGGGSPGEEEEEGEGTGSQAEDGGSQAEDGGSQAEDGGSQAEDSGSQAEDGGTQAEDGAGSQEERGGSPVEKEGGSQGEEETVEEETSSTSPKKQSTSRRRKNRRED